TGYVGDNHIINSEGESVNGALYQFWIKDIYENKWLMIQDYSNKNYVDWIPQKPGEYLYGVHIKDKEGSAGLNAHLYKNINISYSAIDQALISYKEQRINYRAGLQDYDVLGDYLNYGSTKRYPISEKFIFDENG